MPNVHAEYLVTALNLRSAADAMEARLHLPFECDVAATKAGDGTADVYVWWGKVRSGQHRRV